jgi:hypothetical protein
LERAAKDPEDPNNEAAILAAAASTLADKERQMTYDTRLTHAIWDLATSGANPAVDLLVCLERRHTIGFRYVDITRAVVIHHGSKDTRVPVENVRWLGKTMRRCEVRVLEGEGHGLMASAAVMGGVLMEIAREWEDCKYRERNPFSILDSFLILSQADVSAILNNLYLTIANSPFPRDESHRLIRRHQERRRTTNIEREG